MLAAAWAAAACIPAGECTGDCADVTAAGGGGGSSSGGSGGGGGGSSGGGDILARMVENCADYSTVGDVETKLIKPKCGDPAGCHGSSGPFAPNLKTANAYERLFDTAPKDNCKNDKLIDSADASKSIMITKLSDAPKCSDGSEGGEKMPFGKPALSESDAKCLEEYVKAVIAAKAN